MICEIIKKYQSLNYLILGGDISILSEEKHVMPNIDKYFNAVVKWLKPRLKTGHNTYTPPKNIFDGLDAFFETATITINITLMDVDTLSQQSQTKPQKTPTLTNNGKLDNIDINISVTSNEKFLWFELASAFYHEMLHAYEDWNRIKKSGCLSNLASYMLASNYSSINTIKSAPIDGAEELGQILYLISKIEQRAYLNGCIGEYVELMKIYPSWKGAKLEKIIKHLPSYSNYVKLDEYFNVLNGITNESTQIALIKLFNKYSGVIGYVNKEHLKLKRSDTFEDNSHNDFKTYKINTYNSLLKLLKRKIELSQENFISTINKVNVDALINNMQYMQ